MNTHTLVRTRTWAGLMLVLAIGLIHGVEGPANYHEAAYKGILFFLNAAGALVAARVLRVVYGAADERAGAGYSLYNILQDPRLNHECRLTTGVLAEQCAAVIQDFFRARRGRVEPL